MENTDVINRQPLYPPIRCLIMVRADKRQQFFGIRKTGYDGAIMSIVRGRMGAPVPKAHSP